MKSFLRIALVVFLCGTAIGYLYVHNRSMGLTEAVEQAKEELRLKTEKLERLESEVEYLTGFARMDSLWTRAGRPGCDPAREGALAGAGEEAAKVASGVGADAKIEPMAGRIDSLQVAAATGENRDTR